MYSMNVVKKYSPIFSRFQSMRKISTSSAAFSTPMNTGVLFVPERQAWVVERFGKFHRILKPGLNLCIPVVDNIAYVQLLKELAIDIPDQPAITAGDIRLPEKVKEAMQMQVEADRKKRAVILESEGKRDSQINEAEGLKRGKVLRSEGEKIEAINKATGQAEAVLKLADSQAEAIKRVAEAISEKNANNAVQLTVAEKYIDAFKHLAKTNNTMILSGKTNDVSSMVAQAMAIYKNQMPVDQQSLGATTESPKKEDQ